MTIRLNFDKSNHYKLIQLLDWLKGIGVLNSYEVENKHTITKDSLDGEELIDDMMLQAEKDIAAGNLLTSEEVKIKVENWLKEHK